MALCVDLVLNHTAAEHAWARAHPAYYRTFPDRDASPTRTSARCPRSSPTPRPGASRWVERPLGLDDVQRLPVGPRLHEPGRVRGDGVGDARPRRGRRRRAAPGRRAVPVEAAGDQLPEPARGPRAAAGVPGGDADRRARGRLQGRGDRRPARPRPLPRDRPPRGQGVRPRLPQRAHGAAVERAGVGAGGADDEHAAGDAAGPAGRRLADLRALPRRHRLGDHARGRRARRRGRLPAPALPGRLLRGRVPGHVRARRALPARPADGRGADLRDVRVAGGAGVGARRGGASSWRSGACCCCTRSRSPTAGCR